ncbi:MAG: ankyrin repeat domain-containing protein, partial [Chloroflexota bacterium]
MVQADLSQHRPSREARFADTVQAFAAAKAGDTSAVEALLSRDPDLLHAAEDGYPLLYWAAMYGYSGRTIRNKPVIDLLLARGAEFDIFAAAYLADAVQATTLLAADFTLANARDAHGATALHHAAERGATDVARLLVEHGADVQARDDYGRTPLHCAAHPGPWKEAAAG